MKINFTKMHGCGNDFVIIDGRDGMATPNEDMRIFIADRHRGIGCDQLIILENSERADVFMRIYNPDGSEAQACGNATRCVAILAARDSASDSAVTVETVERLLPCRILANGEVEVNMGQAVSCEPVELGDIYESLPRAVAVNVGNPHCVFWLEEGSATETIDLTHWGAKVERHSAFPERTNVEFVSPLAAGGFRVRVWERGAGVTLACGSGATAVAWALHQAGEMQQPADLHMDGGILRMSIADNNDIHMQGGTAHVFDGVMSL